MSDLNEIATWYTKNNDLVNHNTSSNSLLLNMLCFYTKAAFLVLDKKFDLGTVTIYENTLSMNDLLPDYNVTNHRLSGEDIHILKSINRYYGYIKEDILFKEVTLNDIYYNNLNYVVENGSLNLSDDDIIKNFSKQILYVLDKYKKEKLDEKTVIINGKVYFIDPNIILNEEELSMLNNDGTDQTTYVVYRDYDGKLVIY